jgi:hypothetical protein
VARDDERTGEGTDGIAVFDGRFLACINGTVTAASPAFFAAGLGFAFAPTSTPITGTVIVLPQLAHVNVCPDISAETYCRWPQEQRKATAMVVLGCRKCWGNFL